jgi:hypothetical protein
LMAVRYHCAASCGIPFSRKHVASSEQHWTTWV